MICWPGHRITPVWLEVTLPTTDEKKPRKPRLSATLSKTTALGGMLKPHLRPHKILLASGIGLSALLVGFRVAQPWPLKFIIDSLAGEPTDLLPGLANNRPLGVLVMSLAYIVIAFGAALCDYGQRMVLSGLGNRVVHRFRTQLFSHILQLPLAYHASRETGELITRVVYDTSRLRRGVRALLVQVFQNLFLFLVTIAVLLWIDVGLAAFVGVSGVLAVLVMRGRTPRIRRASAKSRKREGKLASVITEAMLGVRELQTFRPGSEAGDRFGRQNAKSLRDEQKVRRLSAGLLLRVEILLAVTTALILWVGAIAVEEGRLTPGDLVLFVAYMITLYRPYRQFARQSARIGRTLACADRLTSIMRKPVFGSDTPDSVEAPPLRGEIVFEKVSLKSPKVQQRQREHILHEVSFHVAAGERVAIVGANGSGKSTLLGLALRLADPDEGIIRLDGHDIRRYKTQSFRRQTSVVFQDSVFFGLSVRENITLGQDDVSFEAVEDVARRSRTDELVENLDEGYETIIKKTGQLFSAGERQRIALARAMIRDGRIWLLDEPTTSLDSATAQELIGILVEAAENRTVLWVTHRDDVMNALGRVIALGEGGVRFDGTVAQYRSWLLEKNDEQTAPFSDES